jgi:hypothetical protein
MMVYQVQGMQPALYHRYGVMDDNDDEDEEEEEGEGGRFDNMALETSLVTEAMSGMDIKDREVEAEAAGVEERPAAAGAEGEAEASTSAGELALPGLVLVWCSGGGGGLWAGGLSLVGCSCQHAWPAGCWRWWRELGGIGSWVQCCGAAQGGSLPGGGGGPSEAQGMELA